MIRIKQLLTLVLVLSIISVPYTSVKAQDNDPVIRDAMQYASITGVDLNTAVSRLKDQLILGEMSGRLATEEKDTFAGLWIKHDPEYQVIAQFTKNGEDIIDRYTKDSKLSAKIKVVKVEAALSELLDAREQADKLVRKAGVPFLTSIDIIDNSALVNTTDPEKMAAWLTDSHSKLPNKVKMVKLDKLPENTLDAYAGLAIGTAVGQCTAGFSVVNTANGTRGISTAGHCHNPMTLRGAALTVGDKIYSGGYDVQWGYSSSLTFVNRVFDGSSNRAITSKTYLQNMSVGDFICRYGLTTGYKCGYIKSLYISGVQIFVADNPPEAGDSGGPWFFGQTAYGITSSNATLILNGVRYTGTLIDPINAIERMSSQYVRVLTN